MIPLWPSFHDPAFKPSFLGNLAIHWKANLSMLRTPRDVVEFTAISLVPVACLFLATLLLPSLFTASSSVPGSFERLTWVLLVTALLFLPFQHVAFVVAMQRTYVPHVRRALGRVGTPVCLDCGNLLDPSDPGSECPECGHRDGSATMGDRARKP